MSGGALPLALALGISLPWVWRAAPVEFPARATNRL